MRVREDGEGVRTGVGAGMEVGGRVGIKGHSTDLVRRVEVVRLILFFILTNIKMYLKQNSKNYWNFLFLNIIVSSC